jgi:NAD(P)-dependent dehydrogenase (short-subunit alcohol dehydrogenase family)
MRDLTGKVAVVTGAASGIGRAMAERFASAGMKVVLADVEDPALQAVAKEMAGRGAAVLAVRTDVSQADEVATLAKKTLQTFGAVHLLCNNAGVGSGGLSWTLTVQDWEWTLGVNLWGVIHGIRTFVPIMLEQKSEGHIVNTASMAGMISGPGMAPYNVSKFGVVTLSETLHLELQMTGASIGVSVLCPGWVNTRINESERNRPTTLADAAPQTPQSGAMREMLKKVLATGLPPAEVANLVVDAIRDGRFYVLTHPAWNPAITRRAEGIVAGRPPEFSGLA